MAALTLMGLLWIGVTVVTAVYFITEPASAYRAQNRKRTAKPTGSGAAVPLPVKHRRRKKKMNISKERLLAMRERHPAGTRITLQSMNDPYSRLQPGDTGTLVLIDDIGTYHVHWDNGSSLGLIPGEDSFSCQPPEQHELKLWMPLTASLDLMDDPDDSDGVLLDGYDLARYEDEIQDALAEYADAEGQARGLMHRYREGGGLSMKVQSVFLSAEVRDDRLWAVADCTVNGELTQKELDQLKSYITDQVSGGWGVCFEQQEIPVDDGELYVSLWEPRNWDIRTEEEMPEPEQDEGPVMTM